MISSFWFTFCTPQYPLSGGCTAVSLPATPQCHCGAPANFLDKSFLFNQNYSDGRERVHYRYRLLGSGIVKLNILDSCMNCNICNNICKHSKCLDMNIALGGETVNPCVVSDIVLSMLNAVSVMRGPHRTSWAWRTGTSRAPRTSSCCPGWRGCSYCPWCRSGASAGTPPPPADPRTAPAAR